MLGVLLFDFGDDGQTGGEDVGGVEPAAQSHLEDAGLHSLVGEVPDGHGRQPLEVGQGTTDLPEVPPQCFEEAGEIPLADGDSPGTDALPHLHQVGGGVESRPVAGGTQDRLQEGAEGTFPLRPGDEDSREIPLGMIQHLHGPGHVPQAELDTQPSLPLQKAFGFGILHALII